MARISRFLSRSYVENPLQLGRHIWICNALMKLGVTSFVMLSRDYTEFDHLFISICLMEAVALVYLLYDSRILYRSLYIFLVGVFAVKDVFSVVYFYHLRHFEIGIGHIVVICASYQVFNMFILHSRVLWVLTCCIHTAITSYLLVSTGIIVAAWYFVVAFAMVVIDLLYFKRQRQMEDYRDIQRNYETLRARYQLAGAQVRTVRHDIRNVLLPLEIVEAEYDGRGCADAQCRRVVGEVRQKVLAMLEEFGELDRHRFDAADAVTEVLADVPGVREHVQTAPDLTRTIRFNRRIFKSLVFNFIMNAAEAYERQYGATEGLRITVEWPQDRLVITDNAGGFDISSIGKGVSTKSGTGEGHGQFLYMVTKHADRYDVDVELQSVSAAEGRSGTRAAILFYGSAEQDT